jgi:hypothetical protein
MARVRIRNSFVARIWLEGELDEEPIWRGHVRHVQGSEEKYFKNLGELEGFLKSVVGTPLSSAFSSSTPGDGLA